MNRFKPVSEPGEKIRFNVRRDGVVESVTIGKQVYRFEGVRPFQRKDGVTVWRVWWSARCADCSQTFESHTSTGTPLRPLQMIRRCEDCRRARKRVRKSRSEPKTAPGAPSAAFTPMGRVTLRTGGGRASTVPRSAKKRASNVGGGSDIGVSLQKRPKETDDV